jgi:c-di-AMP phosphodiesterase-like protein
MNNLKKSLLNNIVIIFFAILIMAVIIYKDVTGKQLSNLYIVLLALFILGECIRQAIKKN